MIAMAIDPSAFIVGDDTPPENVVPMAPPPFKPSPKKVNGSDPLPHSPSVEKSVVSALLQAPERLRQSGLTPQHFHFPPARIVFQAIADDDKGPIDFVSLIHRLIANGRLDAAGGDSAVLDIYNHDLSGGLHLIKHTAILNQQLGRRQAIEEARNVIDSALHDTDAAGPMLDAIERVRKAGEMARSGSGSSLLDRAYALAFDPNAAPPKDEILMSIGDAPIAANGNLTVIQGKSKSGKSATVSAILGAAMRGRWPVKSGDCLGISWTGPTHTGKIIHFDTEQSPADWHALVRRSVVRAGTPAGYPRLLSIPLVRFSVAERLDVVRGVIARESAAGIDLVIIDGVADICRSPNDEEEALSLVASLMSICHEHDIAITGVLHENPGTDQGKTRGHLGSELNRKAFANLRVDKDDDSVSTMWGTDMRKRDIPKSQGICFKWSEEEKMHVLIGTVGQQTAAKIERKTEEKKEQYEREVESIFSCGPLGYGEIIGRIWDELIIKERAAKDRIKAWIAMGIIKKTENGKYEIK